MPSACVLQQTALREYTVCSLGEERSMLRFHYGYCIVSVVKPANGSTAGTGLQFSLRSLECEGVRLESRILWSWT
jgi:hypothetical protein